jgi:hypothetical protein
MCRGRGNRTGLSGFAGRCRSISLQLGRGLFRMMSGMISGCRIMKASLHSTGPRAAAASLVSRGIDP